MTYKPVNEMSTAELLDLFVRMAIDPRTCLIVGELLTDGKRREVVRKRSENMTTVSSDIVSVLQDISKECLTNAIDPDEIVIRILRPVKE